jgi:hypothetical protein
MPLRAVERIAALLATDLGSLVGLQLRVVIDEELSLSSATI